MKQMGANWFKKQKVTYKNAIGETLEAMLSPAEMHHIKYMTRVVNQRFGNDLGYQIDITSLTTILSEISEQKFYEIPFAKYVPVKVGEGKWSSFLTSYRTFSLGDSFANGLINTGSPNGKLASVNTGVDAVTIKVNNWAKGVSWNIFDLQQAALSGNWDLVTSLEVSRKTNWDLGVQEVAFLGLQGSNAIAGDCLGLLNQPGATINSSVITKPISLMTADELNLFCETVYGAYRDNAQRTAIPTHFVMPESDYNGCAAPSSAQFPLITKLKLIEDMFKTMSGNPSFAVLPCSYADAQYHQGVELIANKQVYAMYRYDQTSMAMNVPCDYTATLANSLDSFNFQNAGYGQFTGLLLKRPLELLYFTFAP